MLFTSAESRLETFQSIKSWLRLGAVAALMMVFLPEEGISQQPDGATVRGTVRETTRHPVPGATVVAKHVESGQSRTTSTDAEGQFEILRLPAGTYNFEVKRDGFASQTQQRIQLTLGQLLFLDSVLERRTEASAATQRISESQLIGLPLQGRSYSQLATLHAGISDPSPASPSRGIGGGGLNVGGGRATSNNFLLDGTNIMDSDNQVPRSAAGVQLGSDAILQVQVLSTNYGAEYGRNSGGVLHSITRAGTEKFHGAVFEYFRNSGLDARNFFDPGAEPPPFKRNQFGFTLTGPVRKDQTFFLVSYEGLRDRLTTTKVDFFPDEDARQGRITDRDGNLLRLVEVHPSVSPYLALYPLPNSARLGGGIAENRASQFLPTDENFFTVRVDHEISPRDSFFARYTFDDAASYSTQSSILFRTRTKSRQQYLTFVETHIFSLSTLNSVRLGYTRPVNASDNVAAVEIPATLVFFPGAPGMGDIQVPGLSTLGPQSPLPRFEIMNSFQFADDVMMQKGTHGLKFGFEIHRYRWDTDLSAEKRGQWAFSSLESFLRGGPGGTTVKVALPGSDYRRAYRQTLVGTYIQDEYRIRPGLQLNLGLRYELTTLIREKQGKTVFLADPWRDTEVQIGPLLSHNPSLRNLAPRLGLSWSPTGSGTLVLRGGLGISYDQMLRYALVHRDSVAPFFKRVVRTNFDSRDNFPNAAAAAVGLPVEARIMDYPNMTTPMVLRYHLSVQKELLRGWRVQASYVGARGNHLYRGYEANLFPLPTVRPDGLLFFPPDAGPINPAFASGIKMTSSDAQSFYNALQLSVAKSLSYGFSFEANYTYSKSVDDSSDTSKETAQYGYERKSGRGLSDFDIRHRAVVNYFYALPMGGGQRWWNSGLLSHIFGGWRLGGILRFRTGTPFDVQANVRTPGYLFSATRPNLFPGASKNPTSGATVGCEGVPASQRLMAPDRYFDPCVFGSPEPGMLGTLGRNTLIAPSIFEMDLSLQREFPLDAKKRLQFRAEFFNLPNHTNFSGVTGGPAIVFSGSGAAPRRNASAGRISSTITTSRQIQFALRLSF
ncbi:MAG: TonB-dependent receptor [Acidobacteria bacterium]|nr:TonB-dependent receptor [Acidobacteriota bacterium]